MGKIVPIVKEASDKFKNGNYLAAYNLYKIAGKQYGEKLFSYNMFMCEKKIALQSMSLDGNNRKSILNQYFDKIYLVNLKEETEKRIKSKLYLSRCNVDFELFEATNGNIGKPLEKYLLYKKRELGDLQRYPEYREKEKERGKPYIESAGAVGYIYTYLRILQEAKRKKHKKILILEDDIIFHKHFEFRFQQFMRNICADWKVLQLGASQYNWDSVDESKAMIDGYYLPRSLHTCGSFAIALDCSVYDELIEAESSFEGPFDHLPMGEIYERYLGKCFVCYPNIIMPDVSNSSIRGERCQFKHGKRMKWVVEDFPYPLRKPVVSVIIKSKRNIKYLKAFSEFVTLPFTLNLFFNTKDGLRPLHNPGVLDYPYNKILSLTDLPVLPPTDYTLTLDENDILTEEEIINFIENYCDDKNRKTCLKTIPFSCMSIVSDRVSVIIPTYKRPKNLANALSSVAEQDYFNKEILVVSDNPKGSEFITQTRRIVEGIKERFPEVDIRFIEHHSNRNGSAARNTGLMHATGEFVCFLDDDDIYLKGRLTEGVRKLKTTKPDVGGVYCGFLGWNSPINDDSRYKNCDLTKEIFLLDYNKHYLHTNTVTYKRNALIDINGFDESYRRHQDIELILRFFQRYKIEVVKEPLVRLNPAPSDIINKIYGFEFCELKCKFLKEFKEILMKFDKKTQYEIYKAHWNEIKRYCKFDDIINGSFSEKAEKIDSWFFRNLYYELFALADHRFQSKGTLNYASAKA